MMEIILKDLPKMSLNAIYAGQHWSKRKALKNNYKLIIKNQFKKVLSKHNNYIVSYVFSWKKNPLDAMNCAFMAKMIEDIIFEDDKYNIIESITIDSCKGGKDEVYIKIIKL